MGTIKKSATYEISGAAERRTVPIGELVENKPRRQTTDVIATFGECELEGHP